MTAPGAQVGLVDGAVGAEPVLRASSVTVRFGGLTALSEVGLDLQPREMVGLVGPNGAGKSTLFGVLSGFLVPVSGRVALAGRDISGLSPQARQGRGLSRTFQQPDLFGALTVREHLVLAYRIRHARRRLWRDVLLGGAWVGHDPEEDAAVDELMAALGLEPIADQSAAGLPLGLARLVEMGRALVQRPTVLLLDEPSSGLDSIERIRFIELLSDIPGRFGAAVLLVEHDVDMVLGLCQRIYVLDFGQVIACGTPAEIRSSEVVKAAYLGTEPLAVEGEDGNG